MAIRLPRTSVASRQGFVLVVSLTMALVVAIVVSAIAGYVSHAARETRIFLAKDRCRFAAQSAIEQAKVEIQAGFSDYVGTSGTGIKIDPRQAEVYNWFDHVSTDRRTIGIATAKHTPVTLQDPTNLINGCEVRIAIGLAVVHDLNTPVAEVPVVATGIYTYPDGLEVRATVQERICFATGQSQVFNYAYFVNNYGWMDGSSITINGDLRANGDVSLNASTINGRIYAAENDEVGATGKITLKSSPKIKNTSGYRSAAGHQARPDVDDYNVPGSYDAPAASTTITTGLKGTHGSSIVNPEAEPIPMPFVSDLGDYVEFANEKNGTLTYPGYSYTDSAGKVRSVSGGTISAHYQGTGPSGNAALADNGALVLVGTQSNPIRINGPVVVDNDVIIKGYVSGQGTIYCGRNIHIIGDVKYVNAPSWGHPDANDAAVETSNATKDLLGLIAKGNIVVGDCTTDAWMNSVGKYINGGSSSVVEQYACDESDANIGYPTLFQGSYTAQEYVAGHGVDGTGYFPKVVPATETYTVNEPQYNWRGQITGYKTVTKERAVVDENGYAVMSDTVGRKYYQTVCDDHVISSLKDSAGIGQIDAVLYNNHGIFGTPGKSGVKFNLNGSIVCRDEALIFSGSGINFNWDMRLMPRTGNTTVERLGLPVGPQKPYTVSWQEVPESLNPALTAGGGE